jgi:hypothetical protein
MNNNGKVIKVKFKKEKKYNDSRRIRFKKDQEESRGIIFCLLLQ